MLSIGPEVADAIDRLRRSKDGQLFAEFMQRAFRDAQGRLIEDTDTTRFAVLQGEARVLKVLSEKWINPVTERQAPTHP